MLSFPVLTHKKSDRGQRKDAPISFWKLKRTWDQPTPLPLGKAPSNYSVLLTAHTRRPASPFSKPAGKVCITLFRNASASCEASFHQISKVMLLGFQGEKCRLRFSFTSSLSEEVFDLRFITEGCQLLHKCKDWYMTSKNWRSQGNLRKPKITHSLLLGRGKKKPNKQTNNKKDATTKNKKQTNKNQHPPNKKKKEKATNKQKNPTQRV